MTQKLPYKGTQSFTTFVALDDHKILHHKFIIMYSGALFVFLPITEYYADVGCCKIL
jgi:hypothetical protein